MPPSRAMLFAYYVHDLDPFLVQFGSGFGVRWYGLSYVLAFVVGIWLTQRLARQGFSVLQPDRVTDFIVWGAVFGVVLGGRLGYMLFYDFREFLADPLLLFRVWDGGMASHGGIIGMTLYSLWYARRHGLPWLNLADNLAVVTPLGLCLGRIANFINGELFGRAATVPWAVQFPKELHTHPELADRAIAAASAINPAWNSVDAIDAASRISPALREVLAGILTPRHPSQLYAAALEGFTLFAILWFLRTRVRIPDGVLAGVFFIGYAGLRIVGEFFREPDFGIPLTGPFTRGQFLSLFMFLVGAAFIAWAYFRPTWPPRWRRS